MLTRVAVLLLAAVPAAAQVQPPAAYTIGPEDLLRIVVLGQEPMTGDFAVDGEGEITFPILGKLKVAGETPLALERRLTALLLDGYLKRPQVSVSVKEYRSRRIFVTGEVQRPGTYALKADRSILAVLGDVGAFTPEAGHEIVLIRPPQGAPVPEGPAQPPGEGEPQPAGAEILRLNLRELQQSPDQGVQLESGDTLFVPRAAQVFVTGHVARQGSYRFQQGMTVLEALTLAGGVTDRGSRKGVRIIRGAEGSKKESKVKLGDPVQPGDTIVVPERFF